jgi:hypothetical protein
MPSSGPHQDSDAIDDFVCVGMGFEVAWLAATGVVSIGEQLGWAVGLIVEDPIDRRIVVLEGVEDAFDSSLAFALFGGGTTGSSFWGFEELPNIGRRIAGTEDTG